MSTDGEHTHDHTASGGSAEEVPQEPTAFWESHYGDGPVWSGNVNAVLADTASGLLQGSALDLGCGEGGDVLWLAQNGWNAVGVDISQAAIIRARAAAEAAGLGEDRAAFVRDDLSILGDSGRSKLLKGPFDLVTASFFQSPVALDRQRILQYAADLVAPGGHLLLTSHAAPPTWAAQQRGEQHDHAGGDHQHAGPADFPSPEDELATLALDPQTWETVRADLVTRDITAPDGSPAQLDDTVVLMRRRGIPAADVR